MIYSVTCDRCGEDVSHAEAFILGPLDDPNRVTCVECSDVEHRFV